MRVRIIVDSSMDMTPEDAAQVTVVPMTIHFGEQEYVAGVDIDADGFYALLEQDGPLPTTSQPTPYAFGQVFASAVSAGDSVVCLTISSKLSGTYQSAAIAAADYPGKVYVVDTLNVTIGAGILVHLALELCRQGLSAEDISLELLRQRERVRLLAMVDTLEYLKKGGRISATVAFAGGLLNLKPIIAIEGGEVKMVGTARGGRQAWSQLDKMIEAKGGVDFEKPHMLGYTGRSGALVEHYSAGSVIPWTAGDGTPCAVVGSVVGTHAGPGAVAAAFFAGERRD